MAESSTRSPRFGLSRWTAPRILATAVTVAGAGALLAAEVRLSGGEMSLLALPFFVWPLIPFAVALFGLRGPRVSGVRSIGLTVASGFGLAMYADLSLASRLSSTAGLALLFIPLWQLIGCGVVIALTIRRTKGDGAA